MSEMEKGKILYKRWRERVFSHGGTEPGAWPALYDYEKKAWEDIANPAIDRGTAINRMAQIGSEMAPLLVQLPVLRAEFYKTVSPKKKNELQEKIDEMQKRLTPLEVEYNKLKPIAGWP